MGVAVSVAEEGSGYAHFTEEREAREITKEY